MPLEMDADVLRTCVEELALYGTQPGAGMRRLAYTPEWQGAMDQVAEWLRREQLEVRRDAVGNLFGVLRGTEAGPSILTGSHIDTVVGGGRLDGALDEAHAKGWTVVDMKNDWRRVFPFE